MGARRICTIHTLLVAAPSYLHAYGVPRTRTDLARHRLIDVRFLTGNPSPWTFRDAAGKVENYAPDRRC